MLYQLSYSRNSPRPATRAGQGHQQPLHELPHDTRTPLQAPNVPSRDGGEGNRTPDLLNAIQALSQLSYAPGRDTLANGSPEQKTRGTRQRGRQERAV